MWESVFRRVGSGSMKKSTGSAALILVNGLFTEGSESFGLYRRIQGKQFFFIKYKNRDMDRTSGFFYIRLPAGYLRSNIRYEERYSVCGLLSNSVSGFFRISSIAPNLNILLSNIIIRPNCDIRSSVYK